MLMHMTMYTKGEGNIPWKKVRGPCEIWHGTWIWKSAIFILQENNQSIWCIICIGSDCNILQKKCLKHLFAILMKWTCPKNQHISSRVKGQGTKQYMILCTFLYFSEFYIIFWKTSKCLLILLLHTYQNWYKPYIHCKGTWLLFPKITSDWPLTSPLTFGAATSEPLFWQMQKGSKSGNFKLEYLQKSARPKMHMHMTMYTKGEGDIPWKKVRGLCEIWHGNWIWKSAIFIS